MSPKLPLNRTAIERIIRRLNRRALLERNLGQMDDRGLDEKARCYGAWLAYKDSINEIRKAMKGEK